LGAAKELEHDFDPTFGGHYFKPTAALDKMLAQRD
jgi:hypothetical protein